VPRYGPMVPSSMEIISSREDVVPGRRPVGTSE